MRDSVELDAYVLGPKVRESDAAEVEALASFRPTEALRFAFNRSVYGMRWSALIDNQIEVMFGVGRSDTVGVGYPWLLASPAIERVPMTFLRASMKYIGAMQEAYPILTNVVDARNELHIRWLKWLGFNFVRLHPEYGHARIPFYQFVRIAPCVSL